MPARPATPRSQAPASTETGRHTLSIRVHPRYLSDEMLRQLLALLALLTGLAAVGAPAHAAVGEIVGVGVEQKADSDSESREAQAACVEKQRKQKLRSERVTPCRTQAPVVVYIPTVMFGIDRAFE